MIKTIDQCVKEEIRKDYDYNYQENLTDKLDKIRDSFTQEVLNEVVLWKVNRYAKFTSDTLEALNKIDPSDQILDEVATKEILTLLLKTKGVKLPMASTILRFRNPNIYQILDQRVYRFIKGEPYSKSTKVDKEIDKYIDYLKMLKAACDKHGISFSDADRRLYSLDKKFNADIKIKY